uniref:Uncharacterized protein n=1 Tax=Anguilla anguilla TaxID=7936 RepID=A0A0E9X4F2_ANGAN
MNTVMMYVVFLDFFYQLFIYTTEGVVLALPALSGLLLYMKCNPKTFCCFSSSCLFGFLWPNFLSLSRDFLLIFIYRIS